MDDERTEKESEVAVGAPIFGANVGVRGPGAKQAAPKKVFRQKLSTLQLQKRFFSRLSPIFQSPWENLPMAAKHPYHRIENRGRVRFQV